MTNGRITSNFRRGHSNGEPYQRVGLCCGETCRKLEQREEVALYRVSISRYRCRGCFKLETRHDP